ncbi:hypothetical protein P152DRAFT_470878 [Eremomyces bilateralis CBS 781.70]|uniref:Cora-domain-containing protein n=1 Tax=Eremomyces bilateralis CBS 781.70 TaxID=1392243 RepID=A0A6G1GBQ1_9PEZI|nr:uncharacterized protein P152DRAFT_470878 [Eremomyces bilateralis CBS 781.70]KAF1815444.1 hypothetical protein P152DRAFT_470878 [Eremomyces bilateralis CBS 781.70]
MGEPSVRDFQANSTSPITSTSPRRASQAPQFRSPFAENRARAQSSPGGSTHIPFTPTPASRRHQTVAEPEPLARSTSYASRASIQSRRRPERSNTIREYHSPTRPIWEVAGAEPGVDTKDGTAHPHYIGLHQECGITVVDFSEDVIVETELTNETLEEFLLEEQPEKTKCRWINVNGLSWDVIQMLGNYKKLHRLAIEDLMNTRGSRTKTDWYSDHCFVLLTLQKLVKLGPLHLEGDEVSLSEMLERRPSYWKRLWRKAHDDSSILVDNGGPTLEKLGDTTWAHSVRAEPKRFMDIRSLQRFRGGSSKRSLYMERNSPLLKKQLAVSVEQVSMFLCSDNTVISFFEHSADDIEQLILPRLRTDDTILRRSCDASMIVQAMIDAITDLAMAVVAAYEDVMAEVELDVLIDPDMDHSRTLYILQTELVLLANNIHPISALINTLRDHRELLQGTVGKKEDHDANPASRSHGDVSSSVQISPLAYTYLGDVDDHSIIITQSLRQMSRSTEAQIDFIFNSMTSQQNESVLSLSIINLIFMPLTFLVGYFGMNFEEFPAIRDHSDS